MHKELKQIFLMQNTAKEHGISVSISPFSEYQTDEKFDLITIFHVLEHLENPVRDLSCLAGFLKPDGKLVIEVPNILYPDMAFSHKWHPGHLFRLRIKHYPCFSKNQASR